MFIKRKIKYTILLASAMVLSIVGCKKNDSNNTTITPSSAMLRTVTMLPSGTVLTYYFDSNNRIARLTTSSVSGRLSYVYKGSDSILVYAVNSAGTDSSVFTRYKLNGVGLATTGQNAVPTTYTYTYDVNGYQTYGTSNNASGSSNDTFVIAGNNITEHRFRASDVLSTTTVNTKQVFTYLTDKSNTLGNANRGMSFLGKSSANLMNTEILTSSSTTLIPPGTATSGETYNYSYEYDANSRVSKMTKTAVSSGVATVENYTYY